MRDVTDLYADLVNRHAPRRWPTPSRTGPMDGHPASSKWTLFESLSPRTSSNLRKATRSSGRRRRSSSPWTRGGGYYDSGFIQPVDFFGTGPRRIPMIAVSPFSTGGHVSHVYNEHSSFVKFIERNWMLDTKLSDRRPR